MKNMAYILSFLFFGALYAQDDMYFDPNTDYDTDYYAETYNYQDEQGYEDDYYNYEEEDYQYQYREEDYDDRYYSRRLRRFHSPAPVFGYYDPFFTGFNYFAPAGVTVIVGSGPFFGYGPTWSYNRWNRWDRWNRWNSFNNPWAWNDPFYSPWYGGWNTFNSPWNYYACPPSNINVYNNYNSRDRYYGPRYNSNTSSRFQKSRVRSNDGNISPRNSDPLNANPPVRSAQEVSPVEVAPNRSNTRQPISSPVESTNRNYRSDEKESRPSTTVPRYNQDDFQRSYRGTNPVRNSQPSTINSSNQQFRGSDQNTRSNSRQPSYNNQQNRSNNQFRSEPRSRSNNTYRRSNQTRNQSSRSFRSNSSSQMNSSSSRSGSTRTRSSSSSRSNSNSFKRGGR